MTPVFGGSASSLQCHRSTSSATPPPAFWARRGGDGAGGVPIAISVNALCDDRFTSTLAVRSAQIPAVRRRFGERVKSTDMPSRRRPLLAAPQSVIQHEIVDAASIAPVNPLRTTLWLAESTRGSSRIQCLRPQIAPKTRLAAEHQTDGSSVRAETLLSRSPQSRAVCRKDWLSVRRGALCRRQTRRA